MHRHRASRREPFCSLLYPGGHRAWAVPVLPRKKHKLVGYQDLRTALVKEVHAEATELRYRSPGPNNLFRLDETAETGPILCLRSAVAQRRRLKTASLLVRKEKLKRILPSRSAHLLYVDHTRGSGIELYRLACQLDLEGIVAKRADSIYEDNPNVRHWIKIKNPAYSQKEGRGDLFKRAE